MAARVFGRAQARKLEHLLGAYLWQDSGERRVFRAKGAVYTTSGLVLVQGVGDAFEVSPLVAADTIPASVLTLIGVGLRDEPLGDRLRACLPDDGSH